MSQLCDDRYMDCWSSATGTQKSVPDGKSKPSAATPTTRTRTPLTSRKRSLKGGLPSVPLQNASLTTPTGSAPGRWSSGVVRRPKAGRARNTVQRSSVVRVTRPTNGSVPPRMVVSVARYAANDSKLRLCSRQSRKLGQATDMGLPDVLRSRTQTMSPGSSYGSGSRSTLSTTEKIAVFAPIPSPKVITATSANSGALRSEPVTHILNDSLPHPRPPFHPSLSFGDPAAARRYLSHVPEEPLGLASRRLRGPSLSLQLLGPEGEMRPELPVHVLPD